MEDDLKKRLRKTRELKTVDGKKPRKSWPPAKKKKPAVTRRGTRSGRRIRPGPMLAEAIPPEEFPVIDIKGTEFAIDGPLRDVELSPDMMDNIRAAIRAVGRIEPWRHLTRYHGTGFVVGPDLIATNRHVADAITRARQDGAGFEMLGDPCINFRREIDDPTLLRRRILRPVLMHPYWDFALLETEPLPQDAAPLKLAATPEHAVSGRVVTVIGYPGPLDGSERHVPEELAQRIFRGVYGIKRLQPGRVRMIADHPDPRGFTIRSLYHSASTWEGNSGSPVVDVLSGLVIGIHFGGRQGDVNWSVPCCELRRDARVAGLPAISFGEGGVIDPDGPWTAHWNALQPETPVA